MNQPIRVSLCIFFFFLSFWFFPFNFTNLSLLFSSNLILIVLKTMTMKDMITACKVISQLFALFSFIDLYKRYVKKLSIFGLRNLNWYFFVSCVTAVLA